MKRGKAIGYFLIVVVGLFGMTGCNKDDSDAGDPGTGATASRIVQKVNTFISAYMLEGYLWNDKIPSNIDIPHEPDPFVLFGKLKYTPEDKWSVLTDNIDDLAGSVSGVHTTFGYSLVFSQFSNSNSYFALVSFVYPETPADKAGMQRGDILIGINGSEITEENYMNLYEFSSVELQYGQLVGNEIRSTGKTVSLVATQIYEDPVNTYCLIEEGEHKVGYLCYTDYVDDSYSKLCKIFEDFRNEGMTDLVLDLRYNSGGSLDMTRDLGSMLVSQTVAKNKNIFLKEIWNDDYMHYFETNGIDLTVYFNPSVPVNLGLKRIYILTTSFSASASEATIVGLSPYMEVIQIGENTAGKYCGGSLLQPYYMEGGQEKLDEEIKNWGMYMMMFKYSNRDGVTDFKDGLIPQYILQDNLLDAYPLGDTRDPLLARALELITGKPQLTVSRQTAEFIPLFLSGWRSRAGQLEGKLIQKTENFKK